jgi:uroporphyrinogen-III synthase
MCDRERLETCWTQCCIAGEFWYDWGLMTLLPLQGFTVGVTADRRWREQAELLKRRGAMVTHGPTISTHYLASDAALREATLQVIRRRPGYVVATTGIGVRAWFEAAQTWGLGDELRTTLEQARAVARGPKAAAALQVAGVDTWKAVASERVDEVIELLTAQSLGGSVVAFQQYGDPNNGAIEALRSAGADVIEVPVYRWRLPDEDKPALRLTEAACAGQLDAVTFTSAPAAVNLVTIAERHGLGDDLRSAFNERGVVAACVGPVCAEGAEATGLRNIVAPPVGRLGLLVRALSDALFQRRRELRHERGELVVQGRAVLVEGSVVHLSPREHAVLARLLWRAGAVVPKDALLRQGWRDATVDAHAVETTVARLRRRLGPAGEALCAVPSRGYRLAVEEIPPSGTEAESATTAPAASP